MGTFFILLVEGGGWELFPGWFGAQFIDEPPSSNGIFLFREMSIYDFANPINHAVILKVVIVRWKTCMLIWLNRLTPSSFIASHSSEPWIGTRWRKVQVIMTQTTTMFINMTVFSKIYRQSLLLPQRVSRRRIATFECTSEESAPGRADLSRLVKAIWGQSQLYRASYRVLESPILTLYYRARDRWGPRRLYIKLTQSVTVLPARPRHFSAKQFSSSQRPSVPA